MKIMDRFARTRQSVPGCVESVCRPQMRHRACVICGGLTDGSALVIAEVSFKRTKQAMCSRCSWNVDHPFHQKQKELREQRTKRDWENVTDPIQTGLIASSMPEQYASKSRAAVRAFYDSGFEFAAVKISDTSSLNNSINVLGLGDEVYVEQRDGETILRRVA